MVIRRVIRFQNDYEREKNKQEITKKQKQDVISNEKILQQEDMEEHHEEIRVEEQETEVFSRSYNASNELRKQVERIVAGRAASNMIGVFGINSDIATRNLCQNLREIRSNIIYIGQVDNFMALSDIYNCIAALFFDYLENDYDRIFEMTYYVKEAVQLLEKVYNNNQEDYGDITALKSLSNINRIQERDRNLLTAISRIKNIANYSSNIRNSETKFLITIEMDKLDYKVLNMLSKLHSSDLIIIVFTMLDFGLARVTLRNSLGNDFELECMDKFFYPGNYVLAGTNST